MSGNAGIRQQDGLNNLDCVLMWLRQALGKNATTPSGPMKANERPDVHQRNVQVYSETPAYIQRRMHGLMSSLSTQCTITTETSIVAPLQHYRGDCPKNAFYKCWCSRCASRLLLFKTAVNVKKRMPILNN